MSKYNWPTFEEARRVARSLRCASIKEYLENHPNLPTNAQTVYKDKGWAGWNDFLGYLKKSTAKQWPSYEEACAKAQELGIRSRDDWFCRRPKNFPSSPDYSYKGKGWTSWGDFLGTGFVGVRVKGKNFLPFEAARLLARSLKFKDSDDYYNNHPKNLPAAPYNFYKNRGWDSWADFLGTGKRGMKASEVKERRALLREILAHRDLLSASDILLILKSSGLMETLRGLMPNRCLSEILDVLHDGDIEEILDRATEVKVKPIDDLPVETVFPNDTNKVSRASLRSVDKFATILDEETLQRLAESQFNRLRNLYINEGLAAVVAMLAPMADF
jgi:hypothetical protein